MSIIKPAKYKQFNEVYQVKTCKDGQTFNTLTNPQARSLQLVSRETTQKGNHFLITRLVENFFSNKNDPETRTKFQGH